MTARRPALLALFLVAPIAARAEVVTALEHAMYDYGVAEYCGLVDEAVWDGYRAEAEDIIAAEGLSKEAVAQSSFNAALAVDLEAGDRGLGGYRIWCRNEGAAAVERFRDRVVKP